MKTPKITEKEVSKMLSKMTESEIRAAKAVYRDVIRNSVASAGIRRWYQEVTGQSTNSTRRACFLEALLYK